MGNGILDSYPLIADQTNATLGSQLVTNGDFESGDVDWNKGTGWTITDVGGWSAKCDGTQTDWTNLIQTGVFTLDKFYIINFDVTVTSGTLRMSIQTPSTYLSEEFTTSGNKTVYAIASGTGLFVQGNTDFTGSIDNVSVKQVQGNPAAMTNMSSADIVAWTPNIETDFDVARSSTTTRINASGYIEDVAANVPRLNYDSGDSCPYLLTEAASTNLITYPKSFGNPYWTKSGATIEADSSTAGSELITNGGMETGGTVDVTLPDNWTVYSTAAVTLKANTASNGATGKVHSGTYSTYVEAESGKGIRNTTAVIVAGTTYVIEAWVYVVSGTVDMRRENAAVLDYNKLSTNTGAWELLTVETIGLTNGTAQIKIVASSADAVYYVDDLSIKEVQGFEAPKVDGSGDLEREAYKLVEDTSSGLHYITKSLTSVLTPSADYSHSFFVKKGERYKIKIVDGADGSYYASYNLVTGLLIDEGSNTNGKTKITQLSNGWYRLTLTSNQATNVRYPTLVMLNDDYTSGGSPSYTGDGTSGIYIAYAQLEESDYASSLMLPTTEGSTTSRVADAVTNAGNQSLFNSESGVLFLNIAALVDEGLTTDKWIALSDGTSSSSLRIAFSGGANTIRAYLNVGGAAQSDMTFTIADVTEFSKVGFRYAVDDFSLWVNGVERATDTSGSVFSANTLNELAFNNGGGGTGFYGKTKALAVFDYLSDAEMVTLTTV